MRVLFVCLGNICRSPLAEGLFRESILRRGLSEHYSCASRGTGAWHAGNMADPRTIQNAQQHGVSLLTHRAAQLLPKDCVDSDLLVAMDRSNLQNMQALSPEHEAKMILLRNFDPADTDRDVPDPYYEPVTGFEDVFQIVSRSIEALIDDLEEKRALNE